MLNFKNLKVGCAVHVQKLSYWVKNFKQSCSNKDYIVKDIKDAPKSDRYGREAARHNKIEK